MFEHHHYSDKSHDEIVALIEEECRLNLVKSIIDSACAIIISGALQREEHEPLRAFTKSAVMNFIPDQEERYNLIYDSRLKRYIEQFNQDS